MDSFSVNESVQDFQDLPPDCQSTPKTKRKGRIPPKDVYVNKKPKFSCQYCDKEYVSKWHFNKHVQAHTTSTAVANVNDSVTNVTEQTIQMDVSKNVSFSLLTNVPKQTVFKTPAVPPKKAASKAKPQPKFVCTYCLKGYICSKSYKNHMRNHVIQDAAARFPDEKTLLENSCDISVNALTKTANAPTAEVTRQPMNELLGEIISMSSGKEWSEFCLKLCEQLVASVVKKKCMLPSALLALLMAKVVSVLSDSDIRATLLNILPVSDHFEDDLKSQFLLEFSLNYASEILAFISKTFRNDTRRRVPMKPVPEIDSEDREVIYYIGGSIMRGYFRIAYRYKSSAMWDLVATVLKSKVLCDKPCNGNDASWTRAVDRGGLLYPNEKCQEFLVALTKVIFTNEKSDGSIDYDVVLKEVSNSDISVIWDQMIQDALPEKISLSLMNDVIKCYCRTCGRGFAKRRLNLFREKPVISMPLRHTVARRKKK